MYGSSRTAGGLLAFLAAALACLSLAGPASAWGGRALHVSTRGSDTGRCRAHPCASIGYALTQASGGDRVVVGSVT